jgi:hypothetical protein
MKFMKSKTRHVRENCVKYITVKYSFGAESAVLGGAGSPTSRKGTEAEQNMRNGDGLN